MTKLIFEYETVKWDLLSTQSTNLESILCIIFCRSEKKCVLVHFNRVLCIRVMYFGVLSVNIGRFGSFALIWGMYKTQKTENCNSLYM